MTPVQIIGLGATGLFAYKAFDAMQGKQAAELQSTQLRALGAAPNSAQASVLAVSDAAASTFNGNMILFGVLAAGALGATYVLWNHE